MRDLSILLVALVAVAGALPPGAAGAPTCVAAPVGDVHIVLGMLRVECHEVRDGQRIVWTNADPLRPRDPADAQTGGFCFSAAKDAGAALRFGQSLSIALTWDASEERFRVQVWDHDGSLVAERRCGSDLAIHHEGGVYVPWTSGGPEEVPRLLRMV